jgi:hypothetical protein
MMIVAIERLINAGSKAQTLKPPPLTEPLDD